MGFLKRFFGIEGDTSAPRAVEGDVSAPRALENDFDGAYQQSFHAKAAREATQTRKRDRSSDVSALKKEEELGALVALRPEVREEADREFEAIILKDVPESIREKAFYTKIVGVKHSNPDGTPRSRLLAESVAFETLDLRFEPENKFDPNAIAVCRNDTGEQLGYLDARMAAEVTADCKKRGERWLAVFRHKDYHPETGRVVGGVIYLICLSEEYFLRKQKELTEKN
jgi:hypothetical protein